MLHRSLSFPLAVVLACVTSYGWHCYHQETALFFAKVLGDRTDICSIRIASQSPPVAALTKFQFQNGIYVWFFPITCISFPFMQKKYDFKVYFWWINFNFPQQWSFLVIKWRYPSIGCTEFLCYCLSTAKQRIALSSRKSDFNKRIDKLKDAEVPFTEELGTLIQQLRQEVTCVVRDQRKYSARSIENIRQLQGRIIGTCSAILAVYYEEWPVKLFSVTKCGTHGSPITRTFCRFFYQYSEIYSNDWAYLAGFFRDFHFLFCAVVYSNWSVFKAVF